MSAVAGDIIEQCDRLSLRLDPKNDGDPERVIMDIVRDLVAVVEQLDVAVAEASLQQLTAIDVAGDESRRPDVYVLARTVLKTFIADPRQFRTMSARLPAELAQPTFQEAKRVARGLALGPTGVGWQELLGEFALVHDEDNDRHKLRLEGGRIPEWWGRPSDISSLQGELAETGHDGIALLFLGVALVRETHRAPWQPSSCQPISRRRHTGYRCAKSRRRRRRKGRCKKNELYGDLQMDEIQVTGGTPEKGLLRTLTGHSSGINAVAVTPDGRYAVSASADQTLKVWELESGRALRTLQGHAASVNSVAVTPDGRLAVSASADQTVKVWELESGSTIATFTCDASAQCCTLANDWTIIAGDAGGRIHILALQR